MNNLNYKIFKTGSTTFFTASLFFPKQAKDDVFTLYAFVRKFDDFVDSIPQQAGEYFRWKQQYQESLNGKHSGNEVVDNFVQLMQRRKFDPGWVEAFFKSMELDLDKGVYQTLDETLEYIYGSAEVIGLMMAQILELSEESHKYAKLLGRAFQYMNMIRDVAEDLTLGRSYLPKDLLAQYGLDNLTEQEARMKPEQFGNFIKQEIVRYRTWRLEAEQGFKFIPKRYRTPIEAATEMFDYTVNIIEQNPLIIYQTKVKPSGFRVAGSVIKHLL